MSFRRISFDLSKFYSGMKSEAHGVEQVDSPEEIEMGIASSLANVMDVLGMPIDEISPLLPVVPTQKQDVKSTAEQKDNVELDQASSQANFQNMSFKF